MAFDLLRPFRRRLELNDEVMSRVVTVFGSDALTPKEDLETLGKDGYRKNTVFKACVQEIATSSAEPRLVVERRKGDDWEEVEESHPLRRLLGRPNREQSQYEWLESMVTDLETFGAVYTHKVRGAGQTIAELWNLRPFRVTIKVGANGLILAYKFKRTETQTDALPPEDVIYQKYIDPMDDFLGLPPIVSALVAADMDDRAMNFVRRFFINAGVPLGLLKLKARVEKEERERLKASWHENTATEKGWHTVGVLDADAEYQEIGSRPDRLKLDHVFDITESRICAAFQVPPIIIAVRLGLMRSTYSNYKEARTSFWQETLKPKYERVGNKLTTGLAQPEYGEEIRVRFDLSGVEELQESVESKRKWAREGWDGGLLTRNEARIYSGDGSIGPEGDVFKTKTNDGEPEGAPPAIAIPATASENSPAEVAVPKLSEGKHGAGAATPPDDLKRLRVGEVNIGARDPEWKAIHRVADKKVRTVARTFIRGRNLMVSDEIERQLVEALVKGNLQQIESIIGWPQAAEQLQTEFQVVFADMAGAGGQASIQFLPQSAATGLSFDATNPLVQRWALEHSSNLVREIGERTLTGLRHTLNDAFAEGLHPTQTARRIQTQIGLTDTQSTAVNNYRIKLLEQLGDDPTERQLIEAERRAERYAQKTLRRRALTIARTETIRSANAGQRLLWKELQDLGMLQNMERKWILTPDDLLCESPCPQLADQRVGIDQPFITPEGLEVMSPPAHPNCRCATGLTKKGK
jgi:HK97 family phage portal protein